MHVPVLGRLELSHWPMLFVSLFLVCLEFLVSFITALLPNFFIEWCHDKVEILQVYFPSTGEVALRKSPEQLETVNALLKARDFVEICDFHGYQAEEHVVQTKDGFLLGVHRILPKNPAALLTDDPEVLSTPAPPPAFLAGNLEVYSSPPKRGSKRSVSSKLITRPVVYLHHGLLMNSEVWVVNTDAKKSIAFALADLGFDVWLGNNRGNKYSRKHMKYNPESREFWDFCLDDFALFDIPDSIDYILSVTKQKSLSYIGFSQGSAQAFASLAIRPPLNDKVNLFIAVAPAMSPPGLRSKIVNSLMRASPQLLFLCFGRRAILSSSPFWESVLDAKLYARIIDAACRMLFDWYGENITWPQKIAAYHHLYSYTSVKSVVHWFQIIRAASFHMFEDVINSPLDPHLCKYSTVTRYPTENIRTPIALIYGKTDSLVDIDQMLSTLPSSTIAFGVPKHEHLDLLWGDEADTLVIPKIVALLDYYTPVPRSNKSSSDHISERLFEPANSKVSGLGLSQDLKSPLSLKKRSLSNSSSIQDSHKVGGDTDSVLSLRNLTPKGYALGSAKPVSGTLNP
ncbi:Alpha/Beta hydrolase protein [Yarrowia lipolytica]|jgi:lysosomal acid lipase/cholesteryl ester hydrolase|uniref:YALI0E32035p n=2 Tax=Yarrowia lipolytica TaxID=4952 RepID=Q6C3U6_YARLI|nr:YALI0E32035p [Yarrowia lipolytica CLIB122]AOW06270.1 hypothetical protein YALI1_E37982g [Yarrowia lipolytica]KAB8285472.1 Alpha/Beta hydrolase protein [Yarrowia lipolytica]KAE8175439.1 Alpha/Beta hydrolase protein [Yarrowia lipolytica]KAJ8057643.1 Alpha/Beta hydrolase protein [Yarrowia lipolytica]RDW24695.1 Alpha/Beta hydrolase protein [Yarrowia lipolytica]|eukprot:XP_504666.1 YALI0E32035p [Yarrowia lipolytica CLIB122]